MSILFAILKKSLIEMRRDIWMLVLTVICAPFFVFLYALAFNNTSPSYTVLFQNRDQALEGRQYLQSLAELSSTEGKPLFSLKPVESRNAAIPILTDRKAVAFLELPPDFSRALHQPAATSSLTLMGDLTNPSYPVAAIMVGATLDSHLQKALHRPHPIEFKEIPLGGSAKRTDFEMAIPGMLVFSVMMLIFPCAMAVAREVETGTLRRLRMTPIRSFEFLAGMSLGQLLVGILCVLVTFGTAMGFGFKSQGPLWVAIAVGAVSSLAIIGTGLIVASLARTANEAFIYGNFPLMIFMFFSGSMFPLPRMTLSLGNFEFCPYDLLPTTHGVLALNKVLTLGAGLPAIVPELIAMTILSILFFGFGVWLFDRKHLRRKN